MEDFNLKHYISAHFIYNVQTGVPHTEMDMVYTLLGHEDITSNSDEDADNKKSPMSKEKSDKEGKWRGEGGV
eukprot:12691245-Ditylum_brightwellii.AAC.1